MVADGIADKVQEIYRLKYRPLVIRSTPSNWKLDVDKIKHRRRYLSDELNVDSSTFIIMYHGFITYNRGVETMIEAISKLSDVAGIILGYPSDDTYLESLKSLSAKKNTTQRILFLPPVALEHLWEYAGAADLGYMMYSSTFASHQMCLPNKFFENIQSLTPIICPDYPEMKKIVSTYNIGICCNPNDLEEICNAIVKIRNDSGLYQTFKMNLINAKEELCWENEKIKLVDAYKVLKA